MAKNVSRPLFERLGEELRALRGELAESVALRWQLAVLEIKNDLRLGRQFAIAAAVAVVMGLTALPLLLAALAHALDGRLGLSAGGWLLLFGAVLAVAAPTVVWLAWRRFGRRLVGLRQTLDELH
ncbi:MAG TPA: hypothetical protein DD670_01495, partial [Planctomycetaceae bacterium]|nr:hypothetical protein [Planctomycetaceae bacterium]